MRRLITTLLLTLVTLFVATAQDLTVKTFECRTTDLEAKVRPVKDLNGDDCALIRVYIAAEGCTFDGNIVKQEAVRGEYRIYAPAGTRRLKISHPDFLFLPLNYEFQLKIEKNKSYELRLQLPERSGPVKQALESQFLVLKVTPATATVLVDDMVRTLQGGQLFLELPFGEHSYQVVAPKYHTRKGVFTISGAGRTELQVDLKPAFGTLEVGSSPSGATVMVDGAVKGTTPCSLELESGEHFVQVMSEGYIAYGQSVTISDGATLPMQTTLRANFSQVTLRAPHAHSEIWLGGEKIGSGSWSGRLNAGTYSVEVRTEGYENSVQNIEVEAETPKSYTLTGGHAIYGVLKVTSQPMEATVKLDGKVLGTTPFMSNEVLVGNRTLEVVLKGYDTHREIISLVRDAVKSVELTLKKEELVTVTPSTSPNSQKSYKVGDYYNENGRVGVVFWVDASGQCGKIISMKATGGTQWSSAVQWCRSQGAGWRMPTKQELVALSKVSRLINSTLTSKGGSALSGWYWVSDNYNTERGWRVNPLTGWTETGKKICYDYQARAVAEVAFVSSSNATQKMVEASSSAKTTTPGQYPQATDRLLVHSDVATLSKTELRLMRNEIFARHGYIFKSADLRNHFSKQPWYNARYSNVDAKLTPTEHKNIAFIRKYENQ